MTSLAVDSSSIGQKRGIETHKQQRVLRRRLLEEDRGLLKPRVIQALDCVLQFGATVSTSAHI